MGHWDGEAVHHLIVWGSDQLRGPRVLEHDGVPGASAAKCMLSGSTEKPRWMVIPIFASKNNVFKAYCYP
jgi:hypothetical protein